jgi:hypothetical protein
MNFHEIPNDKDIKLFPHNRVGKFSPLPEDSASCLKIVTGKTSISQQVICKFLRISRNKYFRKDVQINKVLMRISARNATLLTKHFKTKNFLRL